MRDFSRLYQALDQTTSTNLKVAAMVRYFSAAPPADAAWAVYFLSGRRMKRLVGPARLRQWLYESVDLPGWLVDETYASVGDLAETIALLTDAGRAAPADERTLADWLETEILPLRGLDADDQGARVKRWWATLDYEQCYLLNKLLTGALRVGVSRTLAARALAEAANLPRPVILHRLMGQWEPDGEFFERLVSPDDGEADVSRPYPFCLAAPLDDDEPADLPGEPADWQVEWKWDGIRAQLVRRAGRGFLWSRGEDLITERFPEVRDAAASLPDGTVLDGEILAWDAEDGVMDFGALQRRIGRKRVGPKLLAEVPTVFLAYDLLEHGGEDIRHRPLSERRGALAGVLPEADETLRLSPLLEAPETAPLQVAVRSSDEAVLSVPDSAAIQAGSAILNLPIITVGSGSAEVTLTTATTVRGLTIEVGNVGPASAILAPPVMIQVPARASAGRILLPAGAGRELSLPFLPEPATETVQIQVRSLDPTVVSVPASVQIAAGDTVLTLPLNTADVDAVARVILSGGGIERVLEIVVGQVPSDEVLPTLAPPVGIEVPP